MGKKLVKTTFFKLFAENRSHLKFTFTQNEPKIFNFVCVSFRNCPSTFLVLATILITLARMLCDICI